MSLNVSGISWKIFGSTVTAESLVFSTTGLALLISATFLFGLLQQRMDPRSADNSRRPITSIIIIIIMCPVNIFTSACHNTKSFFVSKETRNPADEVMRELRTKLPRYYKS